MKVQKDLNSRNGGEGMGAKASQGLGGLSREVCLVIAEREILAG